MANNQIERIRHDDSFECLQFMFSSWEDFALLLQGFKKRKVEAIPLDRFLRREGSKARQL